MRKKMKLGSIIIGILIGMGVALYTKFGPQIKEKIDSVKD